MRNTPLFHAALPAYNTLISNYFAEHAILTRLVTEAWRFEMLVYALHLYDQREPEDSRSGLTTINLQKICAQQKCASAGRVLAMVRVLRVAGYLHRHHSDLDSRVVQLVPSAKFIGLVEGWNRRIFEIIDRVFPRLGLANHHEKQSCFGWEMRRRGAEHLLDGWKLLDPFPEVEHFVTSDGGWMLLLHCVAETLKFDTQELAPVTVDLVKFGHKFGVSRSHLRRLLESAHAKGLLYAPPHNGAHVQLAPHLVASFLNCMASELDNYRRWGMAAARDLEN